MSTQYKHEEKQRFPSSQAKGYGWSTRAENVMDSLPGLLRFRGNRPVSSFLSIH